MRHALVWVLVFWYATIAFTTVAMSGKPRKATEPLTAAIVVVIDALIILGILYIGGVL